MYGKRSSRLASTIERHKHRETSVTESALNEEFLQAEIELLAKKLMGIPLMSEQDLATLFGRDLKTLQSSRKASPETVLSFIRTPGDRELARSHGASPLSPKSGLIVEQAEPS